MAAGILYGIIIATFSTQLASSHREHKVHNIVLYPDKHSWCKTTPIKQVVVYPGCSPLEIDNNVCVGACFSYSIPKTVPSAPGESIRPYCDSCQPSVVTWKHVTLDCSGEEQDGSKMQKKVQIISNCSCSKCESFSEDIHLSSGDGEIKTKIDALDVPEIMGFLQGDEENNKRFLRVSSDNETHIVSEEANDSEGEGKMWNLLKQFGENANAEEIADGLQLKVNDKSNKAALQVLLKEAEDEDLTINQSTLEEMIKKVEDKENVKYTFSKLKQALARYEKNKNEVKEREEDEKKGHNLFIHNEKTWVSDENEDKMEAKENDENKKNYPANGNASPSHQDKIHEEQNDESDERTTKEIHHHHHHDLHIRHHGTNRRKSLLEARKDSLIDVESHHLKPAFEGTEISYHDSPIAITEEDGQRNTKDKDDDF